MKRMLFLLLALLLVAAAFAACGKDEAVDDAAAAADNMLTTNVQQPITEASYLEYDNGKITCRFRKDEDTWKWVDNEGFPLDATCIETLLATLAEPGDALTPLETAIDPADCGLDDPERYLTVTVGEETTTLYFGDQKGEDWYMGTEGAEEVYLASSTLVSLMDVPVYDMAVLPALPELTRENLSAIAITEYGEISNTVRVTKKVNGWFMGSKTLSDETLASIEAALAEFSFDKCFNYDPSPEAAPLCGLDEPTARITLSYVNTVGTDTDLTVTLGLLREDGFYYATLNDDTTVYLLAREKLSVLSGLL